MNRRIVITGGAGFIGSEVVRQALVQGYEVVNVDALTYAASKENLIDLPYPERHYFKHIDICNEAEIQGVFKKYTPDAVIHLAAESHVDRSISSPLRFIETNIVGTFVLLEASLKYWNQNNRTPSFRFLHVSTDEVFGSLELESDLRFNEETGYAPRSPYSASKASSDHLVRAWNETFGLPTIVTNCSNNYGPRQNKEKLIPNTIFMALSGEPIPVYGDGKNVRDWLFVDDHADALLKILEGATPGASYAIGGETELENLELVNTICRILDIKVPKKLGSYSDQITFVNDRLGHDRRYAIDSSKLKTDLGWSPKNNFDDAIVRTVDWYLNYFSPQYIPNLKGIFHHQK